VGAAVVLDTALLLIVSERINRPFVAVWLKLLVVGMVAFHLGYFGRAMISEIDPHEAVFLDHLFMCLLVSGLFGLPSGMLHAATRMFHTGLDAKPVQDRRYILLYLPLALVPVACVFILRSDHRNLLDSLLWITPFYILWLLVANIAAIVLFIAFQRRAPTAIPFLGRLIAALIAISIGGVGYAVLSRNPEWEQVLRLPVSLSPLLIEGLFVWYALKHRVLPLVMDRSMMYASFLVLGLLLHELVVSRLAATAWEQMNIDLRIVEAIVVIIGLLLIPPLRQRIREALRYLFSNNVFLVRDAIRLLSVSLSQNAHLAPDDFAKWFASELAHQLDLQRAVIVIDPSGGSLLNVLNVAVFDSWTPTEGNRPMTRVCGQENDLVKIADGVHALGRLERGMVLPRSVSVANDSTDRIGSLEAMGRQGILLAFRIEFQSVRGAVLLGDRRRNDRLADEQMTSIALLCDQFAATMGNKKEAMRRFQVERRMIQNEKLSTLGLIAGSLAHELRNPLSSIRTIASLTMEELGPEHPNRQDLAIIVSEIDKLTATTTRLLDSARPPDEAGVTSSPDLVIGKLLVLLTPLAKQLHVDVKQSLSCSNIEVYGSEAALNEILFNLIKNGIEAATGRSGAWVQIHSEMGRDSTLTVIVSDNGPGIDSALLDTLFEPFITGKSNGTGLGLFVVADRVRELNGTIKCMRCDDNSTEFRLTLPRCG
jgi:signal transduction histidine kinase